MRHLDGADARPPIEYQPPSTSDRSTGSPRGHVYALNDTIRIGWPVAERHSHHGPAKGRRHAGFGDISHDGRSFASGRIVWLQQNTEPVRAVERDGDLDPEVGSAHGNIG